MTYTELNAALVEYFGDLEKLCNEIYGEYHGVTNYINLMKDLDYIGKTTVADWDYYFERLKEVRHKRNRLSHGEVSFQELWADMDDVRFVINFRESIMNQTDPLTLLRKYSQPTKSYSTATQDHPLLNDSYNTPQKAPVGVLIAMALLVSAVCMIVFLMWKMLS